MRVIAAYLLAQLGGNKTPDAAAINKVLASVGIEAEGDRVEKLLSELKDKSIEDVIAEGSEKMQALPSGGGGGSSAAAAGGAAGAAEAAKEPEKEPEPEEESDEDMGFGLFD
jgi:large subunit ribosomal protein LP2